MVGNLCFDREPGFTTDNVEDSTHRLLTQGAGVDERAEIDPTQRFILQPAKMLAERFR